MSQYFKYKPVISSILILLSIVHIVKAVIPKDVREEPTSYFATNSLSDQFDGRATFDEYVTYSMRALKQVAGFDTDLHRYDSKQDLVNSFERNLTYLDDLSKFKAPIVSSESDLFYDQSDLTLLENERNQARCGKQMDFLLEESKKLFKTSQVFSESKQLDLIDFIDSFGSPNSQVMYGNFQWLGSYKQCLQAQIKVPNSLHSNEASEESVIRSRYCVANFRSPDWDLIDRKDLRMKENLGSQSVKIGICLPRSCNSISISRHQNRIESLIKLIKLNQIPYESYKMTHLYCLPDEQSPLRQYTWSATSFLLLLSAWLMIVSYFSIKYEYDRMKWIHLYGNDSRFSRTQGNFMRIFALRMNIDKLFDTSVRRSEISKKSELVVCVKSVESDKNGRESGIESCSDSDSRSSSDHEGESEKQMSNSSDLPETNKIHCLKVSSFVESLKLNGRELNLVVDDGKLARDKKTVLTVDDRKTDSLSFIKKDPSIDLTVVDGIKVISMIWLISAHTLLFFIRTISNGKDFWSILKDARFLTVMAGIFPVDTFFTVTGVLTAYLKFSKNGGEAMMRLRYWIEALVHRYFRFMPMYLIVFWYTRDVSEYIGTGPLWDYATANTSLRSVCKQESILVPLLFQANFKPLDMHCVKPAWYLANDYQFLLITPIFMALILKSRSLGYGTIILSILASLSMQFLTVFNSDLEDFEVLINFKPLFGAYVLKDLWKLYVLPYNRIPPYLIGLLTGHLMFSLMRTRKSQQMSSEARVNDSTFQSRDSIATTTNSISEIIRNGTPEESLITTLLEYICIKVWTPLILLISIIYLPLVTKLFTQQGEMAKIGTSTIIAIMRLVWSLSIARLIYICSSRSSGASRSDSFVVRLLSSPKWKPWSKIGLSALLIQWEIISYLAQIQTSTPDMTITFLLSTMLMSIISTYLFATVIYLTIEFPLSQIEQIYIHPALFKKRS